MKKILTPHPDRDLKEVQYIHEDTLRYHLEIEKRGVSHIAALYGISHKRVRDMCRDQGIEITRGNLPKDEEDMPDVWSVIYDRCCGMSYAALKRKYGYSRYHMKKVFDTFDVE